MELAQHQYQEKKTYGLNLVHAVNRLNCQYGQEINLRGCSMRPLQEQWSSVLLKVVGHAVRFSLDFRM
jgi:hypothetical protein